ncbi:MAG TPA: pilin [Patescibacteria group bacterium]|nr:pilin [Patescibacteria group bacterium]
MRLHLLSTNRNTSGIIFTFITGILLLAILVLFSPSSVKAAENQGQGNGSNQQDQGVASADIQNSTCQGAELRFSSSPPTGQECAFANNKPEDRLNALVASIINLFSVVVGIVAVIMIIYGGFKYITSGGDSSNVTGAKNTILYAILGLVIVALAQFIVKFVLAKATGAGT